MNNMKLVIRDVRKSDSGNYVCGVRNLNKKLATKSAFVTVSNKIENITDTKEIIPIVSPDDHQTDKEYVGILVGDKMKKIIEVKKGIPKSHEHYQSVDQEYISMSWITGVLMVFAILVLIFAFVIKIHRVRRKYESSSNYKIQVASIDPQQLNLGTHLWKGHENIHHVPR